MSSPPASPRSRAKTRTDQGPTLNLVAAPNRRLRHPVGQGMCSPKTFQVRGFVLALMAAVALCLAAGSVSHAVAGSPAKVKTRHGKLGTFLVDGKGRTLYLFQKDKTSKS